jgi:hypothetical protein
VARLIHLSAAILLLALQAGSLKLTPEDASGDFEALWKYVDENYAYFDDKLTQWGEVTKLYRQRLDAVQTKTGLIALFETMLSELYDSHAHLTVNTADSLADPLGNGPLGRMAGRTGRRAGRPTPVECRGRRDSGDGRDRDDRRHSRRECRGVAHRAFASGG